MYNYNSAIFINICRKYKPSNPKIEIDFTEIDRGSQN
jgi:hypothetical protein